MLISYVFTFSCLLVLKQKLMAEAKKNVISLEDFMKVLHCTKLQEKNS